LYSTISTPKVLQNVQETLKGSDQSPILPVDPSAKPRFEHIHIACGLRQATGMFVWIFWIKVYIGHFIDSNS